MGTTENIVAGVIIIIILMIGGLFYVRTSVEKKVASEKSLNVYFTDTKLSDSFDTVLSLTEANSGRQFGDLLASAVYYKTEVVNISGNLVNITHEFNQALKTVLGDQEYFFEIPPYVTGINMVFIFSSDPRMDNVFAVLERDFFNLIADLNTIYNEVEVKGKAVVVEGMDLCLSTGMDCFSVSETMMYNNNLSTNLEIKKYEYELFRPTDSSISMLNDWETGLSYHIITTSNYNLTNLELLIPVIDSLPGGSDTNPCPTAYADSILERDNSIIKEYGFIVNPIVVDNGDSRYCQADVYNHSQELISSTKGTVTPYNQNFLSDLRNIIEQNIDSVTIKTGTKRYEPTRVVQRHLQLPNGEITRIRLYVYT
ncbi:hypothetical protein KY348_01725 [Candidatus Woesearchaeota archaeon]|nr:hypothetical protein [Candidatus Woesearchaeota archaeon]